MALPSINRRMTRASTVVVATGVSLIVGLVGCDSGAGVSVVTTSAPANEGTASSVNTEATIGTAPIDTDAGQPGTSAATTTLLVEGAVVPLTDAEAADLIASFDVTDVLVMSSLAEHRLEPAVLLTARQVLDAGASGSQAWAAAYVWANGGDDVAPLLSLLTDPDPEIQVMAATGLIARGDDHGFRPLIAALTNDSLTAGSPAPVWQNAALALVRFTAISANGPPFDGSPAQRQTAAAAWTAWVDTNGASLTFDPATALWSVE